MYTLDISTGEYLLYRDVLEAISAASALTGQNKFDEICYSSDYSCVALRCIVSENPFNSLQLVYNFETKTAYESLSENYAIHWLSDIDPIKGYDSMAYKSTDPSTGEVCLQEFNFLTGESEYRPLYCGDRDRYLSNILAQSENGLIIKAYLLENRPADLGRLVWISKEDFFSGNWGNYKEINMMY